jgi:hypothetical protein
MNGRSYWPLFLLLLTCATAGAAGDERFWGGAFDGSSSSALLVSPRVLLVSEVRFYGGALDGSSVGALVGSVVSQAILDRRFAGGPFDGSSIGLWIGRTSTQQAMDRRFGGGAYDGSAYGGMLQPYNQAANRRFAGGINDGYYVAVRFLPTRPETDWRFHGAANDGYDSTMAFHFPNPLDRDSNGDGLPDWWEMQYFHGIMAAGFGADPDGDGMSNGREYFTGSDPTDSSSVFRILELRPNGAMTLVISCFSNRVYTLYSADQVDASWTKVSGQENIPADPSGRLTLTDTWQGKPRFYRVLSR